MGYKYRHRSTAVNGVLNYIQTKYPECELLKTLADDIPKNQRHKVINLSGVNKFMKGYRISRGSNPSESIYKNALYIQQNFKPFAEYCKQKVK